MEGTSELKLHVYCKSRLNWDEHLAQGKIEVGSARVALRVGKGLCVLFSITLYFKASGASIFVRHCMLYYSSENCCSNV